MMFTYTEEELADGSGVKWAVLLKIFTCNVPVVAPTRTRACSSRPRRPNRKAPAPPGTMISSTICRPSQRHTNPDAIATAVRHMFRGAMGTRHIARGADDNGTCQIT